MKMSADFAMNHLENEEQALLEAAFREKLLLLFARVEAQQPEKGIEALLRRAEALVETGGLAFAEALEVTYHGALERTERRLALIGSCQLKSPD